MTNIPLPWVEGAGSGSSYSQKANSSSTVPAKSSDPHLLETKYETNRECGIENSTKEIHSLEARGVGDICDIFGRRPH